MPPDGDPVLFTTSGMHPLTPYLEGLPHPRGKRLAGLQRCLRTTDLDEVGDDRHLTVFQMLGSWSLGGYEGPQSLRWGYQLVVDGFGLTGTACMPPCSAAMTRWAPTPNRCGPGRSSGCPPSPPPATTGGRTVRPAPAAPTRSCSSGPKTARRWALPGNR